MFKKATMIIAAGALVFSLSACGKQEQQQAEQGAPGAAGAPGQEGLALPPKGQEATVSLPPDVQGKWKSIKVTIKDKETNSAKDITVNIGDTAELPGTKLTLKAVDYVPSFVMQGLNITSASNEQNNPAAKVIIMEDGKEVFKGWLFQKFPTTHAFSHPKYSVLLAGAEKS